MATPLGQMMDQVRLLGVPGSDKDQYGNPSEGPSKDWRLQLAMMKIPKENQALASQAMSTVFTTVPQVPFAAAWAAPQATTKRGKR